MERVRITLDPGDIPLPSVYDALTGGVEYLSRVAIVNWNVSAPPAGFLLRIHGDYRRFEDALRTDSAVTEYDLFPVTERECFCFLQGEVAATARALFENFTRGSLLTVPPIACNDDGTSTFTLVGTEADIQAAVTDLPDPVDVTVEAVGGETVAPEGVVGQLSPRQRDAMEAALAVGYYAVPREATTEDVADEMGCSTATAGEHLQRAESKIVASLFGN